MDKKDYSASVLAKFLHGFPHVDLTFQTVNSTFNLANRSYKEALVFWAGVPVVWMMVTLLIIIMYFCYRCCQREVEKSTPCIKWAIGILALLSCSAVGAGFYGNEEANKGLHYFIDAAEDVLETIMYTESEEQKRHKRDASGYDTLFWHARSTFSGTDIVRLRRTASATTGSRNVTPTGSTNNLATETDINIITYVLGASFSMALMPTSLDASFTQNLQDSGLIPEVDIISVENDVNVVSTAAAI